LEDRRLLSITVDTLVDEADGSILDGDVSLRDAIALAPAGAMIDFAAALTSGGPATIHLTRGELVINKNLTIDGPGASLLTIDASASDPTPDVISGDGSRIFNVDDGTDALQTVSISGLTLTGGDVTGRGGGILSTEALTVTDSTITGNQSSSSTISVFFGFAGGGGIYNNGGTLNVMESTISGNFSWADGGGIGSSGNTTIANSTINGNMSANAGGGIWQQVGTLTVSDCTISDNATRGAQLTKGGGIYSGTNLTLARSTVTGNMAGYRWVPLYVQSAGNGGGIHASGSLTISDSSVTGNTAVMTWTWRGHNAFIDYLGGNGGGISHAYGAATIVRSEVSNNQARWSGGGIAHSFGSLSVTDSTISGNRGDFRAGGIYSTCVDSARSTTSLSVNRSTISANSTGGTGGGIWSYVGNLTITSSTISGNIAHSPPAASGANDTGDAGGVYADNSTSIVSHSTITRNWAGANSATGIGGGIRSSGNVVISHSIVAGNTRGVEPEPDDVTGPVELSFSLLGVNSGATIVNKGGNLIGTSGAPIDPLLDLLADNGGPTQTHALLLGSPAIDAVDSAAVAGMRGLIVSGNLGQAAYSASSWAEWSPGSAPEFAFDGIVAAGWDAGNYPLPVQWLEVDLQRSQSLTGFRLYVDQLPDGETIHQVWVSNSPMHGDLSAATLVHTFAGLTADQDVLTLALSSAVSARFVQIRTTESPSWVGWDEVQVFAGDIPRYDQRGTPFDRMHGARMDMGAFEAQPMPGFRYGDYNRNGQVDTADFIVWRRANGQSVSAYSSADGNGDGLVDQTDYLIWRANFGMTLPATAASGAAAIGHQSDAPWAVTNPQPSPAAEAELVRRTRFGQSVAKARDVALSVLNTRLPQSVPRGVQHLRSPILAPPAELGSIGRRHDLLAAYSELAAVDEFSFEQAPEMRTVKRSTDQAVESRKQALEVVFASLEQAERAQTNVPGRNS
jgi:hypothetical protein